MLEKRTAKPGSQLLQIKTKITLKYNKKLITAANMFSFTGTNIIAMEIYQKLLLWSNHMTLF